MYSVKKVILILIIFIISGINIYSANFNVCGVNIEEPWFSVNNSNNQEIIIIDNDGDIFIRGKDHNLLNNNSLESFQIGNSFFNNETSKYNSITQNINLINTQDSLIIKNSAGDQVSSIDSEGNIYSKGLVASQGSQATCQNDRYFCTDTYNREFRDFYCEITGDKTGNCQYVVTSTQDCRNNDYYYCSNEDYYKKTYTCSTGDCIGNNQFIQDCGTDYNYCSGDTVYKMDYGCSSSGCTSNSYAIQTCPSDYNFCSGNNIYKRDYYCSSGGCSSNDVLIQSCGSNQYCSSGACFYNSPSGLLTINGHTGLVNQPAGDQNWQWTSSNADYMYATWYRTGSCLEGEVHGDNTVPWLSGPSGSAFFANRDAVRYCTTYVNYYAVNGGSTSSGYLQVYWY